MNIVNDGDEYLIRYMEIIESGTTEEFITFAKAYNIFQVPRAKVYVRMCDKIKARLDREGLSHEVVRPE
jgi:hypothetical protein